MSYKLLVIFYSSHSDKAISLSTQVIEFSTAEQADIASDAIKRYEEPRHYTTKVIPLY